MIGYKIEYTIENFSGLINIEEYKEFESNNNKYHYTDKRKNKPCIERSISGVYILYNDKEEISYVGKTINCLKQRLHYHIMNSINQYLINIGDYEESFKSYKRSRYKYMSYIKADKDDVHFIESYLIKKYKPIYNKEYNKDFNYPDDLKVKY